MEEIKTILSHFESILDEAVRQPWKQEGGQALLESLVTGAEAIGKGMIEVGNVCQKRIEGGGTVGAPYYVIHFLWTERAKAFLILWRDILFENQKAQILLLGHQLTDADLSRLQTASEETLKGAATELKSYPEKEIQSARRGRGGLDKQIRAWRLMATPWPTYREQIAFLSAQCRCILDEHLVLKKVDAIFIDIHALIGKTITICENEINGLEEQAKDTIQFIEEQIELAGGTKPGKIAVRLEDLESELQVPNHLTDFKTGLEEKMETLPKKMQVSVRTEEGMIQYQEINFRRSTQQWLESEVLPLLYEIWELTGTIGQSLQMSYVNIRNRAILLATEIREGRIPDVERADLCQPLYAFSKKMTDHKTNLASLHALIDQRLREEFLLPTIYQLSKDFLPVSLQSTINQLGFSRNVVLNWGQQWFRYLVGRFQQFKISVEREESLGISEKIVRFIRNRTFAPENHHYTSIFITKGYIGESFWVGRERELAHMATLVENWQQGFRGTIILTGQRFSGKSLFGELVANRHFSKNTIRLSPKSIIRIGGRHINTSYDLGAALDFIRKYSLNSHPLVWIDDLEQWRNPDIPLSQNVRMLCKNVDNYSGQIFFMVSMSNWLRAHLDKFHEIGKIFQAEINLDYMPAEDIRDAILIRHGATHKILVDDKSREVTPPQFRKMTNRISKAVEGNIGEALNSWASSTQKEEEEVVSHNFHQGYPLPDFLNPDIALVLSAVMLEKRTNEYRLRKLFGTAFTDKYGGIVQRLISLGLLTRHADGWLEVNELVVNYVGKLLDKKKYLKFYN